MASFNKVILIGNMTADPELKQTTSGVSVCSFSIAVNRRFAKEGQQQADFINCVAWRQQAEFICKYFTKGSMIAVVGSIQTRTWDGQDGKKQYATEVIVDEAHFTGSRTETGTTGGAPSTADFSQPAENSSPFDEFDTSGFSAIGGSEDDLPF